MALPENVRADALAGTAVVVCCALVGAPMGLLWAALAPRAQVVIVNRDTVSYLAPEPSAFLGADLTFLLMGLLIGAVAGLLAWRIARHRALGVIIGLVLGGLLASWIAARIGARVGRPQFIAALRSGSPTTVGQSLSLLAKQALVGLPLGALATFAGLFWARRETPVQAEPERDPLDILAARDDVWAIR